jgi:hypothetical protein
MRSAGGHSAAMEGMPEPRLGRESSPCENARVRRSASIRACKTGSELWRSLAFFCAAYLGALIDSPRGLPDNKLRLDRDLFPESFRSVELVQNALRCDSTHVRQKMANGKYRRRPQSASRHRAGYYH